MNTITHTYTWTLLGVFLLYFIMPQVASAFTCASEKVGWQGLVSNSGGYIRPPELGVSPYNAGWVKDPPIRPVLNQNNVQKIFPSLTQTPSIYPNIIYLSIGDRGSRVRVLQRCLNSLGFHISSQGAGSLGQETEYFDKATEQALTRFQKFVGLKETGALDPETQYMFEFPHARIQTVETTKQLHNKILLELIRHIQERLYIIDTLKIHFQRQEIENAVFYKSSLK